MTIRNESGDAVDYDVRPSDPGPPVPLKNAAAGGLISSAIGAAFMGFGCLTGFGDQALVLAGFGFLVVGLVFQGVTLDRARQLSSRNLALGTGKTHLADGDEHAHTFTLGSFVEFWSKENPAKLLAQSPPIFKPTARVILRRCLGASSLVDCTTDKTQLLRTQGDYHVEVI